MRCTVKWFFYHIICLLGVKPFHELVCPSFSQSRVILTLFHIGYLLNNVAIVIFFCLFACLSVSLFLNWPSHHPYGQFVRVWFVDLVQPLDIELGVEVLLEVEVVHSVHQVVHRILQDSMKQGCGSGLRLLGPRSAPQKTRIRF